LRLVSYRDVEPEGRLRWLIRGPHFDMRMVKVEESQGPPETPHVHPWEHEIFVVEGRGAAWDGDERRPFGEGDALYVPAGEPHSFINLGGRTLRFICCIPAGVDLKQIKPANR